jgi:hypothetical protein
MEPATWAVSRVVERSRVVDHAAAAAVRWSVGLRTGSGSRGWSAACAGCRTPRCTRRRRSGRVPGWARSAGSTSRSLEQRRSARRFERGRAALAVVADCGSGCLPRPRPPHGRPTCTGCRIGGACGSSIYLSQSRFAVLGLGDYTFSPYKIAISGLQKQWRRGAWDRLESLLRATASATPPSLVALSSSPSRGVAKTVAAMGAGLSAWPPACRPFCSVSDMTGAMPQPRRDTFTEFPAREGGLPDSQDCRAGTEVSRRSVCAMGSLAAFAEIKWPWPPAQLSTAVHTAK